ncbi:Gfo/Idh/MocA family oxidoreductase [Paenibacillus sp. YIM B09110]|uniref:Gfo/Idh/MocA family oxidoreductase n=1 Tax=Paenibacillus sp. YIM B09110 TaxID=3126102 RepID=UPI00301C1EAD
MTKELRVGLLGYGFAGRTFHAPVIRSVPGLKLAKVLERRTSLSKERYPWVEVTDQVSELYGDDSIDIIVVATPSTNHFEFVRDALLAGKHVVVEKPFVPTAEEADELIALAGRKGKMLSIFHNRRWDGDFLTIQKLLRQGLLGQIMECEFHWDGFDPVMNPGNWRETAGQGAGVFYDLGAHFIDQALCLFGVPDTIGADVRVQREGALAHDYFDVTLGYASGLKVNLKSSRFIREQGPRYLVFGKNGTFVKYGTDPQESALINGAMPATASDWGKEPESCWGRLNTSAFGLHFNGLVETLPGCYHSYYQNIYDHLTNGAELAVKPEEARTNIRLIELALQSHTEGKTLPVTL